MEYTLSSASTLLNLPQSATWASSVVMKDNLKETIFSNYIPGLLFVPNPQKPSGQVIIVSFTSLYYSPYSTIDQILFQWILKVEEYWIQFTFVFDPLCSLTIILINRFYSSITHP